MALTKVSRNLANVFPIVPATDIPDGSIIGAKIALGGVLNSNIADGAVTTFKLASGAVQNDNIADASVNAFKIAANAVTAVKIADANVTTAKIADNAVTTAKMADASVNAAKLVSAVNSGVAKAWINFDGASATIGSGRKSLNVTSVTDNGVGDYTINLAAGAVADANYSAVAVTGSSAGAGCIVLMFASTTGSVSPTTSAFRLVTITRSAGVPADCPFVTAAVFN